MKILFIKYFSAIIIAIGLLLSATAQDTAIIFDRPGVADGPYSVRLKSLQVESGLGYSNTSGINVPTVLIRAPVSKRSEIRFTYNYVPQSARLIEYNNNYGFNAVCIGNKTVLMKEKGWLPDIAVTNNLIYPFQNSNPRPLQFLQWETNFLFQNNITKTFSFNYNLGYVYANYFLKSSWEYSACVNYNLTPKLVIFAEQFGFLHPQNIFESAWDVGFMYQPGLRTLFDIGYINNRLSGIAYHYLALGFSRNFKRRRNGRT